MIDFINKWWHVIALIIAMALGLLHFHDDVKRMQYDQVRHEEAIKELQNNQNIALKIIAKHINEGKRN